MEIQHLRVRRRRRRRGRDAGGVDQDLPVCREPARLKSLDEVLPGPDGPAHRDAPDPGKSPEQLADNAGLRRRLRKALAALPPPYRAVVFLREMEGLSTREVAKVLGISEDSVKTRLHRARIQLQGDLIRRGK